MPTPKPAPGGFFTDRSPRVISQAAKAFKAVIGRYPNGKESELAPREGHPLEQTVDWSDCPLAKAYPQWEIFLHELHKERRAARTEGRQPHPAAQKPLGGKMDFKSNLPGLSAAKVRQQYGDRHPTEEL